MIFSYLHIYYRLRFSFTFSFIYFRSPSSFFYSLSSSFPSASCSVFFSSCFVFFRLLSIHCSYAVICCCLHNPSLTFIFLYFFCLHLSMSSPPLGLRFSRFQFILFFLFTVIYLCLHFLSFSFLLIIFFHLLSAQSSPFLDFFSFLSYLVLLSYFQVFVAVFGFFLVFSVSYSCVWFLICPFLSIAFVLFNL